MGVYKCNETKCKINLNTLIYEIMKNKYGYKCIRT